ncbi:MAG: Rpn family recombination-promoting nuclease/putative transposase [Polyangiaceae bacterium]|nr:Rpn family recombination-promoting nuclease/putative transposase [Polyangiaceae bacterium]
MTNASDEAPDKPQPALEPGDATSPHDALFYRTFSKPEHAAAELRCIFGLELSARVEWNTLRPLSLKFVDAKLTGRYADVLYAVKIGGKEALVYILWEHKSHFDPWTPLQLLEYEVRIWRSFLEDPANKGATRLPVILPVVLHHSERGWRGSLRFRDLFDVAPDDADLLAPYMVDFGFLLDDISKAGAEAIDLRPITPEGRLVLFALRFGRTPSKFFDELPRMAQVLVAVWKQPHGDLVFATVIWYLKTVGKVPEAEIRMAMQRTLEQQAVEYILHPERWLEQQGIKQGELMGELMGELRRELTGELKGKRNTLKQQLGARFGALPQEALARIDAATAKDLDAMVLRVLTADSLDEVLGTSTGSE